MGVPCKLPRLSLLFWKGSLPWTDLNTRIRGHNWPLQSRTQQFRVLSYLRGLDSCLGIMPSYQASNSCGASFFKFQLTKLFPAAWAKNSWGQVPSLVVKANHQDAQHQLPRSVLMVGWLVAWLFTQCRAVSVGKRLDSESLQHGIWSPMM